MSDAQTSIEGFINSQPTTTVLLYANSAGQTQPGALLESWTVPTPLTQTLIVLPSTTPVMINSGALYWFLIETNLQVEVVENDTNTLGGEWAGLTPTTLYNVSTGPGLGVELDSAPEPATWVTLIAGLGAVAALRRRSLKI